LVAYIITIYLIIYYVHPAYAYRCFRNVCGGDVALICTCACVCLVSVYAAALVWIKLLRALARLNLASTTSS
jgi:hypothetical protein